MNAGTVGCGPVFCLMGPLFISLNASSIASWYFPSNTICRTCGNTTAALGASKGLFHGISRLAQLHAPHLTYSRSSKNLDASLILDPQPLLPLAKQLDWIAANVNEVRHADG